jgi:hypothetical protein
MKYLSNAGVVALFLLVSACSSGTKTAGSGPTVDGLPPISGDLPIYDPAPSGDAPPVTGGDPAGGSGGLAGIRCGAKYTCTITLAGKTQIKTETVDCKDLGPDGTIVDKQGDVVARVSASPDGTITVTTTIDDGGTISYTCVLAGP